MIEDSLQGKYFSITDQQDTNTVIYQVNKTSRWKSRRKIKSRNIIDIRWIN